MRLPGRAHFALVEEHAEQRAFDRRLEVGVGEEDVRRLAAELERDLLQRVGGGAHDVLPTSALPVNAILSTSGCSTIAAPAVRPSPVTMLTTPGGKPGCRRKLGQRERRQRRLLGRLQHRRAAGADRRRELPRRHQQRVVPRDDLAGDADRLAQREAHRVVGHRDARRRESWWPGRRSTRSRSRRRRCRTRLRRSACRCCASRVGELR